MGLQLASLYNLTDLNAVMLRIDLVCRVFAYSLVSKIMSMPDSLRAGAFYTASTSLACLPIELYLLRRLWNGSQALQAPRPIPTISPAAKMESRLLGPLISAAQDSSKVFKVYLSSTVWVASLASAMLNYSSLNWRVTFVTHLVHIRYSIDSITLARIIGTLFEILSTVVTPIGIRYAGRALHSQTS